MREEKLRTRDQLSLRIGAVCAVLGAVVSVAAGVSFGTLTNEAGTEAVLRAIASRPPWYWPTVHLGFIIGALLWVWAFFAIPNSLTRGVSWVLGWLGVATIVVGATIQVAGSSMSGVGLTALANAWEHAQASEQASLLRVGDTLLLVSSGTWPSVRSYLLGVPFILSGLAMAMSGRYPRWLGGVGVVGGVGALVGGILTFLGADLGRERLFVVFAQIVSLWMVAMGALMWRHAGAAQHGEPA
ncbi:MAG TPA: hypothetical protein VFH48_37905 [Chloroflexota bacterium]|nr:hypothetical protein [Chloroflexota bacterium]